jgi:hypothetical protein
VLLDVTSSRNAEHDAGVVEVACAQRQTRFARVAVVMAFVIIIGVRALLGAVVVARMIVIRMLDHGYLSTVIAITGMAGVFIDCLTVQRVRLTLTTPAERQRSGGRECESKCDTAVSPDVLLHGYPCV